MSKGTRRKCKGCKVYFELSPSELNFFLRKAAGLARFRLPKYCETCRKKRKLRSRQLARSNFPVPGSRGGDGCFEELTTSDINEISLWRHYSTSALEERLSFSGKADRPKKKYPLVYTIYAPVWPSNPLHESVDNNAAYQWHSVAPPEKTKAPESIKFSIEGRLAGAAWLRDTPEGLLLWWLEYAPWIEEYQKAILSLPFYAIAESIKRGNGGRLLLRPSSQLKELFNSLGCRPVLNGRLLELEAEDAWRLVLKEHRVSTAVINELLDEQRRSTADMPWIVTHVSRGSLTPKFIEAFTYLANDLNWLDIKRLADERGNLPNSEQLEMRHKVRDIFGAIEAYLLYKKLGAPVRYDSGSAPVSGLLIKLSKQKAIKNCKVFDPGLDEVIQQTVTIPANTKMLIITRIWTEKDYESDKVGNLLRLLTNLPNPSLQTILVVSRDFDELDQQRQKEVVLSLGERGIYLQVLKKQAKVFHSYVRNLLRQLDLRPPRQANKSPISESG